jgi:hypothetical protein
MELNFLLEIGGCTEGRGTDEEGDDEMYEGEEEFE